MRCLIMFPEVLLCCLMYVLHLTTSDLIIRVSSSTGLSNLDVNDDSSNYVWFQHGSLISFRDCVCSTSTTKCILGLDSISKQVWKVFSVKRDISLVAPMLFTRHYTCDTSLNTNHITCSRNFMLLDQADLHLFHFDSSCDLLCVKISWSPTQTALIYSNDEKVVTYSEKHGMCNLTSDVVANKTQRTRAQSTVTPQKIKYLVTEKTLILKNSPTTPLFQLTLSSRKPSNRNTTEDTAGEDNDSTIMISAIIGVVEILAVTMVVILLCIGRCPKRHHGYKNRKYSHYLSTSDHAESFNDN